MEEMSIDNTNKDTNDKENTNQMEEIERFAYHHNQKEISYGDMVLVYEGFENIKYFILEPGKVFQNKWGYFKHEDMYGKHYGSKLKSFRGEGFITVVGFVTNLWERCINKLTQILFNPDISIIMTMLNIRNDSIIYESGTGSGCLSTNMSQILKTGHLYTFEFNRERAGKLKEVFSTLKLSNSITVIHRDVVENGFVIKEELIHEDHSQCDGIFIDLPTPWLIVEKAKQVLKQNGVFVSFSPCIEQVMETMEALRGLEFLSVRMFECMYRHYNYAKTVTVSVPVYGEKRKFGDPIPMIEKEINLTRSKADMRGHTGFLVYAIKN